MSGRLDTRDWEEVSIGTVLDASVIQTFVAVIWISSGDGSCPIDLPFSTASAYLISTYSIALLRDGMYGEGREMGSPRRSSRFHTA